MDRALPGRAAAKLTAAYHAVSAAHGRSAITVYDNAGCGNGSAELDPIAFTRAFVPPEVRDGLTYVLVSYYEADCNGIRPSARTWTDYFRALHAWYPNARLGFGEIGLDNPVTGTTMPTGKAMIGYYYGLPVHLPYYVGRLLLVVLRRGLPALRDQAVVAGAACRVRGRGGQPALISASEAVPGATSRGLKLAQTPPIHSRAWAKS